MTKNERLNLRMDRNLYKQLKGYADRNDGGIVSKSALKAINKFLKEDDNKLAQTHKEWKKEQNK